MLISTLVCLFLFIYFFFFFVRRLLRPLRLRSVCLISDLYLSCGAILHALSQSFGILCLYRTKFLCCCHCPVLSFLIFPSISPAVAQNCIYTKIVVHGLECSAALCRALLRPHLNVPAGRGAQSGEKKTWQIWHCFFLGGAGGENKNDQDHAGCTDRRIHGQNNHKVAFQTRFLR